MTGGSEGTAGGVPGARETACGIRAGDKGVEGPEAGDCGGVMPSQTRTAGRGRLVRLFGGGQD